MKVRWTARSIRDLDDAVASISLSREEASQSLMENYLANDKNFSASIASDFQQVDADFEGLTNDIDEARRQIDTGHYTLHEDVVREFRLA
jgi:hypothetical protein